MQRIADTATVRPFAPLVRLCLLSIEWIKWLEEGLDQVNPSLRRSIYDLIVVAQLIDAALDRVFIVDCENRMEQLEERLSVARSSGALHALVSDLEVAATNPDLTAHLRDRLVGVSRDVLDTLARGELPTSPAVHAQPPLDQRLLRLLADVVIGLLKLTPEDQSDSRRVFGLMQRRFPCDRDIDVAQVEAHLLVIDAACAGLHRGRLVSVGFRIRLLPDIGGRCLAPGLRWLPPGRGAPHLPHPPERC